MLLSLHIENIAVVEKTDIDFSGGLIVLTGETGAGKSIVIDSLNAVLGNRISRDIVRSGCEKAYVSASFSFSQENSELFNTCEALGVDLSDGIIILSRDISSDGRTIARINGRQVTASMLRDVGELLVSIHGQQDNGSLLIPSKHIGYLDAYADNGQIFAEYQEAYEKTVDIEKQIDALNVDEKEKNARIELLRYQVDEIEAAQLTVGEDDILSEKKKLLNNAEKVVEMLSSAWEYLRGGESNAADYADMAAAAIRKISGFSPELQSICEASENITDELSELADSIRAFRDGFEFSEGALNDVDERLNLLHSLKRKYGGTIEDVLTYADNANEELDKINFSEETLISLQNELTATRAELSRRAATLTKSRKKAAAELEKQIIDELSYLEMPKTQFVVSFTECEPRKTGCEDIEFLLSSNVGEQPKPLSKIASGGELSRIMLSIKTVLNRGDGIETLIFDEIDSGVSGKAAQKIGIRLRSTAKDKQVISVTHLAQIAVCANAHYLVEKQNDGQRTYTSVRKLDYNGRIDEIARIMGGLEIGDNLRETAKEMLEKYSL